MKRHQVPKLLTALLPCIALFGCDKPVMDAGQQAAEVQAVAEPPAEFVAGVNKALEEIYREEAAAGWIRATYITEDSALIAAKAQARSLAFHSDAVKRSTRFADQSMDEETARSILLLKLATAMPAPDDEAKRNELTTIATRMEGMYGEGKYCPGGPDTCQTLNDLEQIMADRQHDYDVQLDAWLGWHTISPPMREDYQRFVELANEGARELGFSNLGEMWRSGYDMTPADFEQETDRLWGQVKPLYDQLHCYVRDRLAGHYGEEKVSRTGLLPAHLLGNMWAQQWG
ncbi:MAG TPA: M2 family metallopeptidase, partial [Gammaproteobacteria bacterium]|nr:M2 family metallopeptidase [Gammaproteobacteria bacterium]